jgi:hypothetical protein
MLMQWRLISFTVKFYECDTGRGSILPTCGTEKDEIVVMIDS